MRPANRNSSSEDLRFIARHEHDIQKGFGWEVTVTRYRVTYSKQFGDGPSGGKEKALEAAIAFRDSLLALLPPASPVKFQNALNTSGTVGVCFAKERIKSGGSILYCIAYWPDKVRHGRTYRRKFSIEKYGLEEALALAIEARMNGLRELDVPDQVPSTEEAIREVSETMER